MKKERNDSRTPTIDYFLVKHLQTDQIIGRIANVSVGGLMLIANKPLSVRRVYKLQLMFPRVLFERTHISLTAESRWSKFNSFADWWEIGFEIREINSKDKNILQQIIQQLMADSTAEVVDMKSTQSKTALKMQYLKA